MTQKLSRITIDLPVSQHKKLKAAASLIGISMKELIIRSVDEFLHKNLNQMTKSENSEESDLNQIRKIIDNSLA